MIPSVITFALTGFTNPGINQVVAPNGQLTSSWSAERLPLRVGCDIHPWMHGHVMVFDHPFFAVTGADGSFELKGVPAGELQSGRLAGKGGLCDARRGRGMPVKVAAGHATDVGEIKIDPAKVKSN